MAVRRKKSGYEVYWRDPATGKQHGRFFRTKAEAERENRRILHLLRYNREALLCEDVEANAAGSDKYLMGSVCDRYLAFYADKATREERIQCRFLMSKYSGYDVRLFSTGTYIEVYEWLSARGWQPQSVRRVFTSACRILRFARELGLISETPRMCRLPRSTTERFVPPTNEELKALYDAAQPYQRRIILLGAHFGMRVGPCEMFDLRWSDFDFDAWVIHLRAAKKNRHVQIRTLPIPVFLRELISCWHAEDEGRFEHVIHFRGKTVDRINGGWRSLVKRAGIARRIRPYDLRHAFATNMLEKGVDIGTVAKLMGHTTTEMITRHYQFVREERKLDALSRLDPFV